MKNMRLLTVVLDAFFVFFWSQWAAKMLVGERFHSF
jgi:hypothetical protein